MALQFSDWLAHPNKLSLWSLSQCSQNVCLKQCDNTYTVFKVGPLICLRPRYHASAFARISTPRLRYNLLESFISDGNLRDDESCTVIYKFVKCDKPQHYQYDSVNPGFSFSKFALTTIANCLLLIWSNLLSQLVSMTDFVPCDRLLQKAYWTIILKS